LLFFFLRNRRWSSRSFILLFSRFVRVLFHFLFLDEKFFALFQQGINGPFRDEISPLVVALFLFEFVFDLLDFVFEFLVEFFFVFLFLVFAGCALRHDVGG